MKREKDTGRERHTQRDGAEEPGKVVDEEVKWEILIYKSGK